MGLFRAKLHEMFSCIYNKARCISPEAIQGKRKSLTDFLFCYQTQTLVFDSVIKFKIC